MVVLFLIYDQLQLGGWARGFWWQKNATDDVPYQRIGGIGVLGNNLSVSKFYIGYGKNHLGLILYWKHFLIMSILMGL